MKQHKQAFSTLEAMMALAVMAIGLFCAVLVVLGSQTLIESSRLRSDALQNAGDLVESGNVFTVYAGLSPKVNIFNQDNYTRQVNGLVSWQITGQPETNVHLTSLLVDWHSALLGNGCQIGSSDFSRSAMSSAPFGFGPVAAMRASGQQLYLGLSATAAKTQSTFLVFNLASSTNPSLEGSLDNSTTTTAGISAFVVAGKYSYVASARAISSSQSFGQLQVIDITQPQNPNLVLSYKIPGVTGTSGEGIGNSIFYAGGLVYLGLTKTGSGPEFNVIDVHDVLHPKWLGGFSTGSTVNDIAVQGNYAYVAHPVGSPGSPQEQLTVLDVSNPAGIFRVGGFKALDSQGNGKSLFLQENNLYFGRTVTNTANPEFGIFDVSGAPSATFSPFASLKIANSVNNLLGLGNSLLMLTNNQLRIFDGSNLPALPELQALDLPAGMAGSSLACSENTVYASGASAGSGFLSIISAGGK